MDRVKVYNFRTWDRDTQRFVVSQAKSPADYIRRIGGEVLLDTAEYVDPSHLDQQQRYAPPINEPAPRPEVTVSLREVTADTVRIVCALETTEEQKRFVAPNAISIAEAYFEPDAHFRAIYAEETAVGFLLWRRRAAAAACYLWRFMIDARFQRRGHGRAALTLFTDGLREQGVRELSLSCVPGLDGPYSFYLAFGFADTGEMVQGQQILRLGLNAELRNYGDSASVAR